MNMFEKANRLIEITQEIIKYIKQARRKQFLVLLVVTCFTLAIMLGKADTWLPFLQPLKNLFRDDYWRLITSALAAIGAVAFLMLAWLIYRTAQTPEKSSRQLTPSVIKGPSSFGPQDGEFFLRLGRENELGKIFGYIKDPQIALIVVMGESGAGKTSLLRSGLDYYCKKENIPGVYWETVPSKPVDGLIETINLSWNSQFKTLNELLATSRERDAVIILDQFEQLDRDDNKAKPIFKALAKACLQSSPHRTTWIVAFRRDYDPEWRDFELENPKLKTAMLSLKLFNDKQASGVMAVIAEEAGFSLDDSLLKDLINSFRGKAGISPVDIGISMLILDNLAKSKGESHLTASDYEIAGGSGGVLTSYLNRELERLTDDERKEMCKALLRLADLTQNKRIPEGKTLLQLAEGTNLPTRLLESELNRLSSPEVRLLESIPPSALQKEMRYRLPHERLINSLRKLNGIFLAEVEQTRLFMESAFWIWDSNRISKFLLGGRDLRKTLKYIGQFDWGDRAEDKKLFVKESWAKRTRVRLAASAILLTLSIISYGVFLQYRVNQMKRDLEQWGLPNDLYEYQLQLSSLTVHLNLVTHTDWLKGNLTDLDLKSQGLRNIGTLPLSITVLNLSNNPELTSLAGIEKLTNLTNLDLSSNPQLTHLAGIENLTKLTTLTLNNNPQLTSLAGIEKLTNLTTLNLNSTGLTSLAGIEKLTNLTSLDLSNNPQLTSLAGIEKLTNLTTLNLNSTRLTRLAGVEELTNLTSLALGKTEFTSLVGIEKLTNLTSLDLSFNKQLTNVAGIEKLTKLTSLDLNNTGLLNLASIENLTNLNTLSLSGTGLTSLAGIENLNNLTTLDLSGTRFVNLANIDRLTNLTTLNLNGIGLTELGSVKKLTKLVTLKLSFNNQLTDLAGIENLTGLTSLNILELKSNKQLTSLSGIEKLTNLTNLDLSSNPQLTSLAGVENLTKLTTLTLNNNPQLTSLAGIEKLTNLTTLNLNSTGLTSLAGIEKLTNLTSFNVTNTELTNVAGIGKLTNLTSLDLSNTKLTSLDGLENCEKLTNLKIYGLGLKTLNGLPSSVKNLSLGRD